MRRVVHAARYAETLPPGDRGAFWSTAVEKYLATKLAAITAKERRNPHCSNCGDGRGGPFGHEISECTFRREGSDHA